MKIGEIYTNYEIYSLILYISSGILILLNYYEEDNDYNITISNIEDNILEDYIVVNECIFFEELYLKEDYIYQKEDYISPNSCNLK